MACLTHGWLSSKKLMTPLPVVISKPCNPRWQSVRVKYAFFTENRA